MSPTSPSTGAPRGSAGPPEQVTSEYLSNRLPRLHRAAYLLCGDRHRAEDIVQATALNLYLKWKQARAADNMDGYVHRMLVREFLGQSRLRWSRVLLTDRLPDLAPPGARTACSSPPTVGSSPECSRTSTRTCGPHTGRLSSCPCHPQRRPY
jgi:hypothetical protein